MQFLQQIVLYKKYTFIRTFSSIVFLTCLLKKKSAKIILHYCSILLYPSTEYLVICLTTFYFIWSGKNEKNVFFWVQSHTIVPT